MINVHLTNLEARRISELVQYNNHEIRNAISKMAGRKNFNTIQKIVLERTHGKKFFKVANDIAKLKRRIIANDRLIKKLEGK